MDLRPRFGLPVFRRPGLETFPCSPAGRPSVPATTRRPTILACLVAGALALTGCSADTDRAAPASDGEPTEDSSQDVAIDDGGDNGGQGDGAAGESAGELSFGDPVDAGFDEVVNTDVEPEQTPAAETEGLPLPDEVIPTVTEELETSQGGDEILDTVDVIDTGGDVATDRDGRSRNSSGELALLDEAASLACAHVEVALSQLDDDNKSIAIERIWQAADRAGASQLGAIREWQEPLAAVIAEGDVTDLAPLIGFITVCAEGGYEL